MCTIFVNQLGPSTSVFYLSEILQETKNVYVSLRSSILPFLDHLAYISRSISILDHLTVSKTLNTTCVYNITISLQCLLVEPLEIMLQTRSLNQRRLYKKYDTWQPVKKQIIITTYALNAKVLDY